MMTYTEIGLALIADAIASGKQVRFSKIELIADPERSAGELIHNADIASVEKYNNTTIDIKAVTDNYNFKNDYFFNRVNVYATGSDGQEVLFCFQHTVTCPVYIPAYDGRTIQNEIKIRLTVTSADVVDIVNDGVYVLRTDFEKELAKKINTADIIQDADSDAVDKVVSAAVAKYLKEQIEDKIDKSAIIQNATTAALDKVVSAAVAKNLQDQITAQNTKLSPQGSFSEVWTICSRILGSSTVTEIPMRNGDSALTISSASIFTESGWHDVNVSGLYQRINCWSVVFDTGGINDMEMGKSYLIKLSGNIS